MSKIHILMACYNGANFIEEQIESILKQVEVEVFLTIRDDGSHDSTLSIIKQYMSTSIEVLHNSSQQRGYLSNFRALVQHAKKSNYEYFCFSDQDDVWEADKLLYMQKQILQLESSYGKQTPILVHSDLSVVATDLTEIAQSFIKFQGLPDPNSHGFPEILYQNVVTGCACMFNRALLNVATPIPEEAIVHDWWLALCAKYFGILEYIPNKFVKYRQHEANAIGAIKNWNNEKRYRKLSFYKTLLKFPKHFKKSIFQAKALHQRNAIIKIKPELKDLNILTTYSHIEMMPLFKRISMIKILFNRKLSIQERIYLLLIFIFLPII